ncbi:MAG: histidine kinase dimerization/phospho-acceptor domain-containing protein, partial [Syntrophales bacterium]
MLKNAALDGRRENGPPPGTLPPHLVREFDERLFLQDARQTIIIGSPEASANAKIVTLYHQNKVIGYVGIHQKTMLLKRPHQRFLEEQKMAFAIVAGVIVFLSAGLSLLLATRMVRPLKKISTATHLLAQGEYSVRVPVDSNDELGRLATDFNALALAMEHNEQARRRWVADISHELRTPLTFLRSQVEAILDGVRQPSMDSIQAIHHEILRFSRLVDDLYQLSMSDVGALTYRKEEAVVTDILTEAVSMLRPAFSDKNIALHCKGTEEAITVFGDKERLGQGQGDHHHQREVGHENGNQSSAAVGPGFSGCGTDSSQAVRAGADPDGSLAGRPGCSGCAGDGWRPSGTRENTESGRIG